MGTVVASAWGNSWGAFWGNSWGLLDDQPEQPDEPVTGGGLWAYSPMSRAQWEKARAVRGIKRDQRQAAEIAVQQAIESAPVRDRTLDLLRAEESLIDLLNAQNAAMTDILRDLLRIEYELWLAEQEESAIVMILFDL